MKNSEEFRNMLPSNNPHRKLTNRGMVCVGHFFSFGGMIHLAIQKNTLTRIETSTWPHEPRENQLLSLEEHGFITMIDEVSQVTDKRPRNSRVRKREYLARGSGCRPFRTSPSRSRRTRGHSTECRRREILLRYCQGCNTAPRILKGCQDPDGKASRHLHHRSRRIRAILFGQCL